MPKDAMTTMQEADRQLMDICLRMAQFFGFPKSVGECYGLFFVAEEPLALDHVIERLGISKGAASQALKELRLMGAVRLEYVPGDRRDHYVIEPNLGSLVEGLWRNRMEPGLQDYSKRLELLEQQLGSEASTKKQRRKLAVLRRWEQKALMLAPALRKMLLEQ